MSDSSRNGLPRLKGLGFWLRCGVSVIVLGILGGYGVAGYYLQQHYENRDERPGLTLTDIEGAYAGAEVPSPLLGAIERGHPETMSEGDQAALVAWLRSETTERDFENFDLDPMPSDLLFDNCVSCHARNSTDENAMTDMPFEFWDDIGPLANTKTINPKDMKIVIASIHAHLPSMAMVLLAMTALAACTRWPGWVVGIVSTVAGLGLIADFAGQFFAQQEPQAVLAIVGGGALYAGGVGVLGLAVLADCWLPGGRGGRAVATGPAVVPDGVPLRRPV